jgi:helicase required for RNAi-mediated heterochromatin assembly 1
MDHGRGEPGILGSLPPHTQGTTESADRKVCHLFCFYIRTHTHLTISHSFPLSEHLVDLKTVVDAPQYRLDQPGLNLSSATTDQQYCETIDALLEWPDLMARDSGGKPLSELDDSQADALRRILTKRLAIVQGPPGTGKTFISVVALRTILANMNVDDPPIIVSAHTNHALDQIMRHIHAFEPRFVRLGGQTLDKEIIEPRTIQRVRDLFSVEASGTTKRAVFTEKGLFRELQELLQPLLTETPFSPVVLKGLGLLTHEQQTTLENIEKDYVGEDFNNSDDPINIFCGDQLTRFKKVNEASYFGIEYEEYDEDIRPEEDDVELEFQDDKFELLHGKTLTFQQGYTAVLHPEHSDKRASELLRRNQDMTSIPSRYRGSVYGYLQKAAKQKIAERMRDVAARAKHMAKEFQIGRWEQDSSILFAQNSRVIGMTTTGLSKYRALVTSLRPKIVLIEEAGETLEAYTIAACLPSLEHMILVGDHQQLRGHCNVKAFESAPWNLDVSMFERLVRNRVEYTQLKTQRRMRPIIREFINPIYPQLVDHHSVKDRADVLGMGGLNSCFFTHDFPESNDDMLSKQNVDEANFIVNFYKYLIQNGTAPAEITILTFYNGQRRLISRMMLKHAILRAIKFKIATVDSYQGEENEVILLSLTRNNECRQIGFLSVDNRVCVALSRARRGFYIFGESISVFNKSALWRKVLEVMGEGQECILEMLPLKCQTHGNETFVSRPSDFEGLDGGCRKPCRDKMPCGHACRLHCHPQKHEDIVCEQPCLKRMACGHFCTNQCWYTEHECKNCQPAPAKEPVRPATQSSSFSKLEARQSSPVADTRLAVRTSSSSPANRIPPPFTRYVPGARNLFSAPSNYTMDASGLPKTPLGEGYRNFAAGGVQQEDIRQYQAAQRNYQQTLDARAREQLEANARKRQEESVEHQRNELERVKAQEDQRVKLEEENFRLDDFEPALGNKLSSGAGPVSQASERSSAFETGKIVYRAPASRDPNVLLDISDEVEAPGGRSAGGGGGVQKRIWKETYTSAAVARRMEEIVKEERDSNQDNVDTENAGPAELDDASLLD